MGLHPVQAITSHYEPDLQSTEASTEGDRPVAVVNHLTPFRKMIAKIRRGNIKGIGEIEPITDEETAVEELVER